MCSRVKKKQSPEIVKLRKELEQAKKKISNLSHKVNTLLRERDRFQSPGISNSITDQTTVDWRGKLEMEKKVRLARVQSQTDPPYQVPHNVNSPSAQSIKGNKMRAISSNGLQVTCVIPDFPPTYAVRDVSQIIWPYENRADVVGALPSLAVPSIRPVQMFYNYQPSAPTGFIPQDRPYFENAVQSPRNPYLDPSQAPLILAKFPTATPN